MIKPFLRFFSLLACFLFIVNYCQSQDLLRNYDLTSVKVDKLSDADIAKLKQQLDAAGISEQQAEQIAISKGMPVTEVQKLRARLQQLSTTTPTQPNNQFNQNNQNILDTSI